MHRALLNRTTLPLPEPAVSAIRGHYGDGLANMAAQLRVARWAPVETFLPAFVLARTPRTPMVPMSAEQLQILTNVAPPASAPESNIKRFAESMEEAVAAVTPPDAWIVSDRAMHTALSSATREQSQHSQHLKTIHAFVGDPFNIELGLRNGIVPLLPALVMGTVASQYAWAHGGDQNATLLLCALRWTVLPLAGSAARYISQQSPAALASFPGLKQLSEVYMEDRLGASSDNPETIRQVLDAMPTTPSSHLVLGALAEAMTTLGFVTDMSGHFVSRILQASILCYAAAILSEPTSADDTVRSISTAYDRTMGIFLQYTDLAAHNLPGSLGHT